jgi:hypothetical protein
MSTLHASDLDAASRSDLIARAEALGIDKADVLTRAELVDEIVKRTVADPIERRLARGLLGVARDLVARVVERGLHLPDAAALIRGLQQVTLTPVTPPIATVTLADIYAGQGHRTRALTVLDEVLEKEPEHTAARALREKIAALPHDVARTIAPSEPAPEIPLETIPISDLAADRAPARDRAGDGELDRDLADGHHAVDRDLAAGEADDDDPEGERDTLPPEADAAPTLAPADVHHATWHAEPPIHVATEAAGPAQTEPLFGGDDVDQIVLVAVDATSAVARWELGASAIDEARARAPGGELTLRIVAVTPSWDGPQIEIRDIEVVAPVADWWVCDLPSGAELRAAIGWRGEHGFDPLAVALDVDVPSAGAPVASERWRSQHAGDDGDRLARIAERARRRAEEGRPAEGRALSSWRNLAPAPWEAPYEAAHFATIETR